MVYTLGVQTGPYIMRKRNKLMQKMIPTTLMRQKYQQNSIKAIWAATPKEKIY